ncbi:MAG: glycosyltransferase family 2 protein [Candidatus Hydrogenedentota bacterium]|nr:MAG: glycosyltransferase family 2 protein [Candidatus Hydrogenedentota bacterium]
MAHSEEPVISVIIPNYNGGSHLPECLDSLLEQSYKNLEIIVVDNASTDGSVGLVTQNYRDARVVCMESNRGFSSAVNAGIGVARGELVVVLNNDTRAESGFVRELHRALSEEAAAAMAAPKMLFARSPHTINSMGLGYSITGTNHDIGFGLKDGPRFETRDWLFGPCGGAGMYRRSLFEEVGPFDEDLFMYYEDVDYSFRAQLAGCKCISVPTARVYHSEGASGVALPRPRNYYFARNSSAVILKNFPRRLLFKYFHAISWEIAKRAVSPLLRGDTSALQGYIAALGLIGSTLKKRREVQRRRRVPARYIENILKKNRSILKEINLRGRPVEELT